MQAAGAEPVQLNTGSGPAELAAEYRRETVQHTLRRAFDLQQSDVEGALRMVDWGVEFNPENPDVWYWRGYLERKSGDSARAIDDLRKATALRPGFAPAYDELTFLALQENRVDEALDYANQLIRFAAPSDRGRALYHRGSIYHRKGDEQQAQRDAAEACASGFELACRVARGNPR